MAVLFLDFDGVTHPDPCRDSEKFCQLALIEQVLREFRGVQVVISSSWRAELAHLPLQEQLELLRRPFASDIRPRVIGVTPDLWENTVWKPGDELSHHRERECLAWLKANRPSAGLDLSWIALDDRGHWFRPDCRQLLLMDDPSIGFTQEHARQLRKRLAALEHSNRSEDSK
jgi:hypothetical protein